MKGTNNEIISKEKSSSAHHFSSIHMVHNLMLKKMECKTQFVFLFGCISHNLTKLQLI